MITRWLAAALLSLLAACAHAPPRFGNPDKVWPSSRSLENAKSCVIAALDERGRSGSRLAPNLTHKAKAVVPGKVYEITAEQELAVTSETYLVRLEKIDDRITRISLYAHSPWEKELTRAIRRCGART
jgi:hypothetical protein